MQKTLGRIFKPPVFEDERKTYQAYLLNIVIWGMIAVPVPYVLYVAIVSPHHSARAVTQAVVGEAINILLLILLHRGYVRGASVLQVTAFWVFLTVSAVTGVGVQGESYLLGYPLVIVIAGVLLGGRAPLVVTAASLAAGLLMVYAEQNGLLRTDILRPAFLTWVISLAIFPMGALLQFLASHTVQRALERVRMSEEKFKLISRVSTDYTFESEVDEYGDAKTVWMGGAFERMTGYTLDEYKASGGWYAHIHPDDLEKDAEDMRKLRNNEEVVGSEIRTFAKDGTIRWERVFAHPVWNETENRLVGIIGAVQDVTGQKEAEALLKETLLRQTAILDNIPDMAWLKDINGRYIAVNQQYLNIKGIKEEDIIGKTDYEIWDKKFADHYHNSDLDVIQSRRRQHAEDTLIDHAGREHWFDTIKTPIFNPEGDVVGTIGIARDITERKLAEIERERLISELEAKNAELERFTYTVSHDLKAPLVTINGFLGFLEKDIESGDAARISNNINRIAEAAKKMKALLNDLLELSRVGRTINPLEDIPFQEIVHEAMERVRGRLDRVNASVEIQRDLPVVRGDRIRLIEVMQNLLDNAAKYVKPRVKPRIEIGAQGFDETGCPVFHVRDNGIGIEPRHHDHIFGLFNKLDAQSEGTGIGLSLVKRIIEVHGGRIWVESEKDKGATFYFTLPAPPPKE